MAMKARRWLFHLLRKSSRCVRSRFYAPCFDARLIISIFGGSPETRPRAGVLRATSLFAGPGIVPLNRVNSFFENCCSFHFLTQQLLCELQLILHSPSIELYLHKVRFLLSYLG